MSDVPRQLLATLVAGLACTPVDTTPITPGQGGGGGDGGALSSAGTAGTQLDSGAAGGSLGAGGDNLPPPSCPPSLLALGLATGSLGPTPLLYTPSMTEQSPEDAGLGPAQPDASVGDAGSGLDPSVRELPPPPENADELFGWATVQGLGRSGTTGGAGAPVVTVTTATQLLEQASSPNPLYIQICGEITAPVVDVASDKTIVGLGSESILHGGLRIRGDESGFVRNVIVQNLVIDAGSSQAGGDGIKIQRAHHVWVHHSEVYNSTDEAMSVTHGSDYITLSWNLVHFTADTPDPERRLGLLIGESDAPEEAVSDIGHLNVTVAYNWWSTRVRQRAPRVRFGKVHVLNNYYTEPDGEYGIWIDDGASLLIEGNYFAGTTNPHENVSPAEDPASILARNNTYDATSGLRDTTGSAFTPPYSYPQLASDRVPEMVQAQAGPR